MKKKLPPPRKKRQHAPAASTRLPRHAGAQDAVARLLLNAALLLWEDAERERSSLSTAAAWAVSAVREHLVAGDSGALGRIGGYQRSDHLSYLVDQCDLIIGAHANDRRAGIEKAISHAILEVPRVFSTEIPRTETLDLVPADEAGPVERSLAEAARDIASDLLRNAKALAHVDGQSVVRAALVIWGVSRDRAAVLLAFLREDKRPRKTERRKRAKSTEGGSLLSRQQRMLIEVEHLLPLDFLEARAQENQALIICK